MGQKSKKTILKDRLIGEGWFGTEQEAAAWAMLRRILVNDQPVTSIHVRVAADAAIRVKEYYKRQYVNKGGLKLEKAVESFPVSLQGAVAFDCGASMGGFTDCLLQHGAKLVYAVDAGFGQLAGKLLADPRVVNMERTNISDPVMLDLDPTPHFATLDLSYLSLKKAIPIALQIMKGTGTCLCLVKPLYEVYNSEVRRSGNINDQQIHREILDDLLAFVRGSSLSVIGLTNSPILGNNGTIEYLIGITTEMHTPAFELQKEMERAISEAFSLGKFKKNST